MKMNLPNCAGTAERRSHMTVNELIDHLKMLKSRGLDGKDRVKAFNGDSGQLEDVTGFLYGGTDGIVEILTDED